MVAMRIVLDFNAIKKKFIKPFGFNHVNYFTFAPFFKETC